MSYPKSKKSKVMVRAKVPWERNVRCLIAVTLDVESILESVGMSLEEEYVRGESCMKESRVERK